MKSHNRITSSILLFACITTMLASMDSTARAGYAEVSNVRASQRADGSGVVDIYYDLIGEATPLPIGVSFSTDNGSHWDINPASSYLTGDVGASVTPGMDRHIIWDASLTGPFALFDQMRAGVTIDAGSITSKLPGDVLLTMVSIPSGNFMMGANSTAEMPIHAVSIESGFFMSKFEVTQA